MSTNKNQWKQIEAVVRKVIHEWDPYQLIAGGAPDDEWDDEIMSIVGRVSNLKTEAEIIVAISEVFSKSFQPAGFALNDCAEVGQRLFTELNKAGLI